MYPYGNCPVKQEWMGAVGMLRYLKTVYSCLHILIKKILEPMLSLPVRYTYVHFIMLFSRLNTILPEPRAKNFQRWKSSTFHLFVLSTFIVVMTNFPQCLTPNPASKILSLHRYYRYTVVPILSKSNLSHSRCKIILSTRSNHFETDQKYHQLLLLRSLMCSLGQGPFVL